MKDMNAPHPSPSPAGDPGVPVCAVSHPSTGAIDVTWRLRNGHLHRDDGPAYMAYGNGNNADWYWYQHNQLDRVDGPAITHTVRGGLIINQRWMRHDNDHRTDGPADISLNGAMFWVTDHTICGIYAQPERNRT